VPDKEGPEPSGRPPSVLTLEAQLACPGCGEIVGRLEGTDPDGRRIAALRPGYERLKAGPWAVPEPQRRRLKQGRRAGRRPSMLYESGRGAMQIVKGGKPRVASDQGGHGVRLKGGPRLVEGVFPRSVSADLYCWSCRRRLRFDVEPAEPLA
jgi:hypothetical protein